MEAIMPNHSLDEIVLMQINCDCQPHDCELCPGQFDLINQASVAVGSTRPDDPRIFMICGRHSLLEIAANLD
jgi:hypothetical protein